MKAAMDLYEAWFCFSGDFLFLALGKRTFWGLFFIFSRLLFGKSKEALDVDVLNVAFGQTSKLVDLVTRSPPSVDAFAAKLGRRRRRGCSVRLRSFLFKRFP